MTTSVTNHVIQEHSYAKSNVDFQVEVRNLKKFLENCNELFQAGSIANKADEWHQITSDKWVLQTVEGAKTEIEDVSALAFNSKNKYEKIWSKTEKINFRREINTLMSRGVIKPISDSENGFVSSIFLREKKENKHRLILNLKEFNKHVVYRHFKMDNLKTALNMMSQNCFMVSFDLSDDYYSVSMALIDKKYLLFKLEGQLYKSVCVPNGLPSAPRIFTKLLKPVFSA